MAGIRCDNHKARAVIAALTLSLMVHVGLGVSATPAVQAQAADTSKLVINIPSRTLWVYEGDHIIRNFPVGLGRPGYMTPIGHYSILTKVIDPGWEHPYLPSGKVRIAPGHNNPLGTRWMGFYHYKGGDYGMHGTDRPSSVGKYSSHGCVRMQIRDAEALFDLIEVGTPLEVVYQPVLIRPQGNTMRIVVYPDSFHKGMPSANEVAQNIQKDYPGAKVDAAKISAALAHPTQQPIAVGQLSDLPSTAKASDTNNTTSQTSHKTLQQTASQPPNTELELPTLPTADDYTKP